MKPFKKALFYTMTVFMVLAIFFIEYYRFTHQNLTETQLFLRLWKEELFLVVYIVALSIWINKNNHHKVL